MKILYHCFYALRNVITETSIIVKHSENFVAMNKYFVIPSFQSHVSTLLDLRERGANLNNNKKRNIQPQNITLI